MRHIKRIIIHCSDTPEGRDDTAADIDRWHRAKGWDGIGYHYVVRLDGTIETGRPLERPGAHCAGYNQSSIGNQTRDDTVESTHVKHQQS